MIEPMTMDDDGLMKAYGRGAGIKNRFWFLLFGIIGFLFPGWYVHQILRLYKTGADNEDFKYLLSLTKGVDY